MAMLASDEADLEFFFAKCGKYQPSLFGPMLERASIMRTDSEGKPIAAPKVNYLWRPDGEDQAMRPAMAARNEPSYTPDVAEFHRFGLVSRRLNRIGKKDPLLRAALTAYYGDSGSRWREMAIPARDDDGNTVRPGYGPGQIVSLYALTKSGLELLRKATGQHKKGPHRTVDEHLEAALLSMAQKPKSQTKQILDVIRLEADALLLRARSAYLGACVADDPRRSRKLTQRPAKTQAVRWPGRMEESA